MAGDKRKVQEINAGSMADIAFLLLIFFLVATTMNTDTGLVRVLPPMPDPNQKQEDVKVKERNLLLVFVSKGNNIMAGGQQMFIYLFFCKPRPRSLSSTRWKTKISPKKR